MITRPTDSFRVLTILAGPKVQMRLVVEPFLHTDTILLQEGFKVSFVVWSHVVEGKQIPKVRKQPSYQQYMYQSQLSR